MLAKTTAAFQKFPSVPNNSILFFNNSDTKNKFYVCYCLFFLVTEVHFQEGRGMCLLCSEVTLAFNPMLGKEQKLCVCVFI